MFGEAAGSGYVRRTANGMKTVEFVGIDVDSGDDYAAALEEAAARYVTAPSRSLAAPPPHLTGGAVDLTLGDGDGSPLDLGTTFDAFTEEAGARALEDVPGEARGLRRLLFWAMAGQGFTAYHEEWWHYDHGDQFWGLATGRPAIYGAADPPGQPAG